MINLAIYLGLCNEAVNVTAFVELHLFLVYHSARRSEVIIKETLVGHVLSAEIYAVLLFTNITLTCLSLSLSEKIYDNV